MGWNGIKGTELGEEWGNLTEKVRGTLWMEYWVVGGFGVGRIFSV